MKASKVLTFVSITLALAAFAVAQSPSPSPAPFDALGVYNTPNASPSPSFQQVSSALKMFPLRAKSQLVNTRSQVLAAYIQALATFKSDSVLTAAQKSASLSPASQTEVITVAWMLYNLLTLGSPNDASGTPIPLPPAAPLTTGTAQ